MKQCPKCGKNYADAGLNFCLDDGTQLIPLDVSEPTVVMQKPPQPKKRRTALWIALVVIVGLGGLSIVGALLILNNLRQQDGTAAVTTTAPPTPAPTIKPKVSPSSTPAAETSPTPAANVPSSETDDSDEITPIAWDTTAGGFKGEPGRIYRFECTPAGTPQGVWGSDVYTDYSSICTAAVHAGVITVAEGGIVTLEYRPGRAIYGSTTRHDIKTNTTGEYSRSFVVR